MEQYILSSESIIKILYTKWKSNVKLLKYYLERA